ncbi:MAG TPA: hypothetical protein VM364_07850 [Vicinamibacterales bacterium]|nr:hypothetical protein [Vicinamibacterales bacterium]
MKKPKPPKSPIDGKRLNEWTGRFGSYRSGIAPLQIQAWLEQFNDAADDRDVAARILDVVEYYGQQQIRAAFREALAGLPGWHASPAKRQGRWRFAAMSGSAGESGDSMLHEFRVANQMGMKALNDMFVTRTDLFRAAQLPEDDPNRLGAEDVVVFVDDFSGTGQQVCTAWEDPEYSFGALLAGVGTIYLILVAASRSARKRIAANTGIQLAPAYYLNDGDNVFSEHCKHFSAKDRGRILHYGRKADAKQPKGFGDCGFVVVFQHGTPNNSIPILHGDGNDWTPLFPRHD